MLHRRVVQRVEQRPQHHCDAEREKRDFAAAGRALGEFGIHLDVALEARLITKIVVAEIGTRRISDAIGIVRMGLLGHGGFLRYPAVDINRRKLARPKKPIYKMDLVTGANPGKPAARPLSLIHL